MKKRSIVISILCLVCAFTQAQEDSIVLDLKAIEVKAKSDAAIRKLRNVEGTAIYAAKKSEVIALDKLNANLATNNARQAYKGVAGLNIWESDGAGLQLSIGARGLDPNRTAHFNTRQNGYDISADALGYPESYYTPPLQALKRIEIVRGAASLQYGPQFGGLLNFVFKEGNKNKKLGFSTDNTIGSFGLLSSFNSIGGQIKNWNYYAFYQRKQGNGWRENSKFHQNTAYLNISKKLSQNLKIGLQYTFMEYLAQQAGGLQDFEFNMNPRQSNRARNWFKVNWNLAALNFDWQISEKSKINNRTFALLAQRQALGELGPINRPDPLLERDLVKGKYKNFGNETRFISRYQIANQLATLLVGLRYYQGYSESEQGLGSADSDANFNFLNPDDLENSAYEYPSKNIALFAENLFNINQRWSITPGFRLEHIGTAADGYYKYNVYSGGELIFQQAFSDMRSNKRNFMLLGLGSAYRLSDELEVYSNFSQNFRSINFSDLTIVNPNLQIDSLLKDERGFNIDLGVRGQLFENILRLDASVFYLKYKNRIGLSEIIIPDPATIEKAVAYRTNIGDARIMGLETYAEFLLSDLFKKERDWQASAFLNLSLIQGQYVDGQSFFIAKQVELIPPINLKSGFNFSYKNFQASYQVAYTAAQFSDATNAEFVADATRGRIPAYSVQDLSFSYQHKNYRIQTGINNLTNATYFTRRATAYPGPGIIPSDGRNFYFTLGLSL